MDIIKLFKRQLFFVIISLLLSIITSTLTGNRINFHIKEAHADMLNNVWMTEEERAKIKKDEEEREKENKKSKVKVIYPINNMIMYEQRDWIAGVTKDKEAEYVHIKLIDVQTGEELENDEEVELEDNGLFMHPVEYVPGENKININGDYIIDIFYKENDDVTPPKKFRETLVHQSVPELCQECHDTYSEDRSSFPLNEEVLIEICDNCHKSRIYNRLRKEYKNIHQPVKEGRCIECHEIHISKYNKMLKVPQKEICAKCHAAIIKKTKSAEFVHLGNIFEDMCSKCHNPHSSNINDLIRDVRKGICSRNCHEKFSGEKEGVEYKSIHKPVVQGKCYFCHNMHGGKNKFFLIKSNAKETCVACHPEKLSKGHGSKLQNCDECHNAHISEKEGLFTDKGIKKCLSCHKDLNYRKDIPKKSNCQFCHAPHSNDNVKMAKESCFECHIKEKLAPKHNDFTLDIDMCSRCHQLHGEGGKGLLKPSAHPLKEERCKACHKSKEIATAKTVCLDCHKGVYEARHPLTIGVKEKCVECHLVHGGGVKKMIAENQHKPFKEGKCSECHKSVDASLAISKKAASGELCLGCHKDIDLDKSKIKSKEEAKAKPRVQKYKNMHKPFEKRECVKCHETHASRFAALQRAQGQQLCYKCHKSKEIDEIGKAMFSVHQPINEGQCLGCHFPHGSENKRLLREALGDICFTCHDNFLYKVPVLRGRMGMEAEKMTKETLAKFPQYKVIHKPITEKGCVICHNPHSSNDKKLLVSEGDKFFCYKCHKDFTVDREYEIKSVHKPVSDEDCMACHEMHASDNDRLLKENTIRLCNEKCHKVSETHHETKEANLKRFVAEMPKSFTVSGGFVLCTNCHDPHSSKEIYLFKDFRKKLCLQCHTTVPSIN